MIREMEEINFRNNVFGFIHMIEDVDEWFSVERSEFQKFRRKKKVFRGLIWLLSRLLQVHLTRESFFGFHWQSQGFGAGYKR